MSKRIAVIDLGSNSARVMLMEAHGCNHYRLLDEIQEPVRISENMGDERIIKPSAINRALMALKSFKRFCDVNDVNVILGIATAALRTAKNRAQVLSVIKEETGISLRVLSGEEEARYEYLGVVNTMNFEDALIVDIGGASTEIIFCKERKMIRCISLPFGAVNITEKFLPKKNITEEEIGKLNEYLKHQYSKISWLKELRGKNLEIIGVGGTMRNLARVDRHKKKYSFKILRNYSVAADDVNFIYEELYKCSLEERKRIPGISKNRVDVIVGGIAIAVNLVEFIKSRNIRVSGCGLREGIFYEYLFQDKPEPIVNDVVDHSVQNFMNIYSVRKPYAEQVAQFSLFLYEQLKDYFGYGKWEKKLLRIAALLHDVGTCVCYYDYPKHSMYILLNARINGLSHREQIIVALITACHKKEHLKSMIKKYSDILLPSDEILIRRLGMILRTGEKINKGNAGIISEVIETVKKEEAKAINT